MPTFSVIALVYKSLGAFFLRFDTSEHMDLFVSASSQYISIITK